MIYFYFYPQEQISEEEVFLGMSLRASYILSNFEKLGIEKIKCCSSFIKLVFLQEGHHDPYKIID